MNFTWKLILFMGIIHKTSGIYEPWEGIKKWYDEFEYDRKGAEIRHANLEKNCSAIHNKSEGLCYDECMFRIGYDLLIFGKMKGALLYGSNADRGLEHLERNLLRLKGSLNLHDQHEHAVFKQHLERCWKLKASFILPHQVREIWDESHEEGNKKICSEMLNEEKMGHMRAYVNCFKEQIKNVWKESSEVTFKPKMLNQTIQSKKH